MRLKHFSLLATLLLLAACVGATDQTGTKAGAAGAPAVSRHPGSQEDLVATVGDRVFFRYDKSDLAPEARQTIQRWADYLKRYSNLTVTIEGHCDERGTREYNLALGQRRAAAAKNFLTALGIPASRVSIISYGKERPAVLGSNEAAWAQNRRAVLVIDERG